MSAIIGQRWFFGYISSVEAEELLYKQKVGTYLVRFSRSSPGAFALEYVREPDSVNHVLIKSTPNYGFETQNHSQTMGVSFPSMSDLLQCFSHRLREPLRNSFLNESWFCGEFSIDLAEAVLHGKQLGCFLVYKNSSSDSLSHFIISFVGNSGVSHCGIYGDPSGVGLLITGEHQVYENLGEIVMSRKELLKNPVVIEKAGFRDEASTAVQYGSFEFDLKGKPGGSQISMRPPPVARTGTGTGIGTGQPLGTPMVRRGPPAPGSPRADSNTASRPTAVSPTNTPATAKPLPTPNPTPNPAPNPTPNGPNNTTTVVIDPRRLPPKKAEPAKVEYGSIVEDLNLPKKPEKHYQNMPSPSEIKEYTINDICVVAGNTILGENGEAGIAFPATFASYCGDFTYQVTCIGKFANIYVEESVDGKSFQILGGVPQLKVSWQVTGKTKV